MQAWEDTYAKWDQATKQILNFPKNKADDGQVRYREMWSYCLYVSHLCWEYQTWFYLKAQNTKIKYKSTASEAVAEATSF